MKTWYTQMHTHTPHIYTYTHESIHISFNKPMVPELNFQMYDIHVIYYSIFCYFFFQFRASASSNTKSGIMSSQSHKNCIEYSQLELFQLCCIELTYSKRKGKGEIKNNRWIHFLKMIIYPLLSRMKKFEYMIVTMLKFYNCFCSKHLCGYIQKSYLKGS